MTRRGAVRGRVNRQGDDIFRQPMLLDFVRAPLKACRIRSSFSSLYLALSKGCGVIFNSAGGERARRPRCLAWPRHNNKQLLVAFSRGCPDGRHRPKAARFSRYHRFLILRIFFYVSIVFDRRRARIGRRSWPPSFRPPPRRFRPRAPAASRRPIAEAGTGRPIAPAATIRPTANGRPQSIPRPSPRSAASSGSSRRSRR